MKQLLKVDSRRRVTLPSATPGEVYTIRILEDGKLELVPSLVVDKYKVDILWEELNLKKEINIPSKAALYNKLGIGDIK